ncbi:TylF/MycF/NovP-related O-methyltransferase [Geomonas anaerohicana]|uniref:Class I SAM-dependent methyltransferase n=1 Tax=Geomonas anaerohicana TaxID=2798583 RepID=A0ABS0YBK1_9BACT|nr:TylF/MycF/NovP-related O-methyltransferase [Geomonas anaerohicana]MBJ6749695.1 class I SAM-dependent methyltransferase [Geomonas anaerohicana]
MLKDALKRALEKSGYQVRKKSPLYRELETEAAAEIATIRPYTMLSQERLLTLYDQVRFCEHTGLPGCYVECGVWKGGSVGLMALANLRYGRTRRMIHLFDSFQEICEPDVLVDGARAVNEVKKHSTGGVSGKLQPLTGIYDSFGGPGTLEGNKDLLEGVIGYDPGFLQYHQGWFQETLPLVKDIGEIAILRLDGDWYASTKVCLEHLYDKVVTGGFIIIDDYGAYDGCRKAVDEFIRDNGIKAYLSYVDMDCRYWIKQ